MQSNFGFVYILYLNNNKYYVGSTDNLDRRLFEHQHGKSPYTSKFLPVKLVFNQQFSTLKEARNVERCIKKLKSRLVIEKIIKNQQIGINR